MAHAYLLLCQYHRLLGLSAVHFSQKSNNHFLTREQESSLKASIEYKYFLEHLDLYLAGNKWYCQRTCQGGLPNPMELLDLEAGW